MTIEDQIIDKKLQYDINREAAEISALSSGKIDKYEYHTGEEILPSNQQQIIEQAKLTYSPLGKAFEKQTKTIEDQGKKQIYALVALKPKNEAKVKLDKTLSNIKPSIFNDYFKDRLDEIKKYYEPIDDFNIYDDTDSILISFGGYEDPINLFHDIINDPKTLEDAKYNKKYLKSQIKNLENSDIPVSERYKINKIKNFYNLRNYVMKMFDDYNLMQKGEGLKILTPSQMPKRLPIALAQVKAGNNSESLLNEIKQIVYSLYRSKEITKKVYDNIIKAIKV